MQSCPSKAHEDLEDVQARCGTGFSGGAEGCILAREKKSYAASRSVGTGPLELHPLKLWVAGHRVRSVPWFYVARWLHKLEIAISIPYQQFALVRFLLILLLVTWP